MLDASIIIPVLNQWNYTRECLTALLANREDLPQEIIVVDNGSTDETPSGLASFCAAHSSIKVISYPTNIGYAAANNAAAKEAKARYLVLLNNDTVPQPGWLTTLLSALSSPGTGIVGPRLLFPLSRKTNHAGYSFDLETHTYATRWCFAPGDSPEAVRELDVLALLGACLCIERQLFFELGGFETFGLEDIDLCLKARERGYRIRYIPSSTVLHHGSVTLVNTDPSLLIAMNTDGFSARWPPYTVARMQIALPQEAATSPQEHQVRAAFALEESVALVTSALSAAEGEEKYAAEFKLRCALELWRANEAAYEELIVLLVSQRRTDEALSLLETYKKVVPGSEKAANLALLLGKVAP